MYFCVSFLVFLQVYVLNPVENLRGYITNRPPLVIFMISVSAVAIAFLTVGYFFKIKEIKSPELTEVSARHHVSPFFWTVRLAQTVAGPCASDVFGAFYCCGCKA